jgi:glycosyltransferase involved in cell wall biosynthesis
MPSISVVVPMHGDEPYLAECLDALLVQRYPASGYEIIVVDNGASPAARGVADARAGVRVIEEPRPGAYVARNAGLRVACGDIIAFTDADCAPERDWLSSIERTLRDPATNIVVGSYSPARSTFAASALAAYENEKNTFIFSSADDDLYYGFTNNMAVRARLFHDIGPFMPRLRGSDAIFARTAVERYGRDSVRFEPSMSVRHLEIEKATDYYRKVFVHSRSIRSLDRLVQHRPLHLQERLDIFRSTVRSNGYSPVAAAGLLALLVTGMVAWEAGALVPWKDIDSANGNGMAAGKRSRSSAQRASAAEDREVGVYSSK